MCQEPVKDTSSESERVVSAIIGYFTTRVIFGFRCFFFFFFNLSLVLVNAVDRVFFCTIDARFSINTYQNIMYSL